MRVRFADNERPPVSYARMELRTNREIEDAAVRRVLSLEHAVQRAAEDVRGRGAAADIDGDRIIEVTSYGNSARGSDLWFAPRQVQAAEAQSDRLHLVIVENVRQGNREDSRVLRLSGATLTALLNRKPERHYVRGTVFNDRERRSCHRGSTADRLPSEPGEWHATVRVMALLDWCEPTCLLRSRAAQ